MPAGGWQNLYSIGGYGCSLEGAPPDLQQLANNIYAAARTEDGVADISFQLSRTCQSDGAAYCLATSGVELCRHRDLADFFPHVEWTLMLQAMQGCWRLVQVHAGVRWQSVALAC